MFEKLKGKQYYDYIIGFYIIDLVLGGAGTYLSLGPISIRKILFAAILLLTLYQYVVLKKKGNLKKCRNIELLFLLLIVFGISTVIGIINNPIGYAINKFLSYSYIFILPFFLMNIISEEEALDWFDFFRNLVLILATLSSLLFVLLFIAPNQWSELISKILSSLNIGIISIGSSLPRVFLKTSIFIPFILNYEILKHLSHLTFPNKKEIFRILILGFGVFSSMTMGIWGSFLVVFVLSLFILRKNIMLLLQSKRNMYIMSALFLVSLMILLNFGVFDILIQRFSGSDPSMIIKGEQTRELVSLFIQKPLLGHGFGKVVTVAGPQVNITSVNWEIMWLELLVNSGIVGLSSYFFVIFYYCTKGYKLLKMTIVKYRPILISIVTSFVGLIVINFSNPFLNNPIGIGYFILMVSFINAFIIED